MICVWIPTQARKSPVQTLISWHGALRLPLCFWYRTVDALIHSDAKVRTSVGQRRAWMEQKCCERGGRGRRPVRRPRSERRVDHSTRADTAAGYIAFSMQGSYFTFTPFSHIGRQTQLCSTSYNLIILFIHAHWFWVLLTWLVSKTSPIRTQNVCSYFSNANHPY